MIASNLFKQIDFIDEGSLVRSASVLSLFIHILIIGVAMYGLPKFGRQLPALHLYFSEPAHSPSLYSPSF